MSLYSRMGRKELTVKRGRLGGPVRTASAVVGVVVSLALAVTGCARQPDETAGQRQTEVREPDEQELLPQATGADVKSDLKIAECEGSKPNQIGVRATVEVTNSGSRPWRYRYDIVFRDPSGEPIATALGSVRPVEPGDTTVDKNIPGDTFSSYPDVSCEFGDRLERLPPK